jgi:hypothetical protein
VLPIENYQYRKHVNQYKGRNKFRRPLQYLSVETLLELPLKDRRNRSSLSVPTAQPLAFPTQSLPIPPFVFGLWFASRGKKRNMWVATKWLESITQRFKDNGYQTTPIRNAINSTEIVIHPTVESQLVPLVPTTIPENYLLSSKEQRLELLSGILHASSKTYKTFGNKYQFETTRKSLFRQVQYLAESLGCRTISFTTRDVYCLRFKSPHILTPDQQPVKQKPQPSRRYISRIDKIQPQMCVYIELEDKNETFLVEEGFIACR